MPRLHISIYISRELTIHYIYSILLYQYKVPIVLNLLYKGDDASLMNDDDGDKAYYIGA